MPVNYTHDLVDQIAAALNGGLDIGDTDRVDLDVDPLIEYFDTDQVYGQAIQVGPFPMDLLFVPDTSGDEPTPQAPYCAILGMPTEDPDRVILLMHVMTELGWTFIGREMQAPFAGAGDVIIALLEASKTPGDSEVNLSRPQ